MNLSRRRFLIGASAVAATAVIKANIRPAAIEPGAYLTEQPAWVPEGWLLPRGQMVSRATYPRLFAALGEAFGEASPIGFRLPDFPQRQTDTYSVEFLISTDDNPDTAMPVGAIMAFVPKSEA